MPASVIMHDYNNSYNQREIPIAYMQGIPDPESGSSAAFEIFAPVREYERRT